MKSISSEYLKIILVLLFTYFAQSAFAAEKCAMSHQLTDSSKKIYCLDKFDFSKRKYSNFNIPLDSAARASNCWSLAIPTEESCNNIIGFSARTPSACMVREIRIINNDAALSMCQANGCKCSLVIDANDIVNTKLFFSYALRESDLMVHDNIEKEAKESNNKSELKNNQPEKNQSIINAEKGKQIQQELKAIEEVKAKEQQQLKLAQETKAREDAISEARSAALQKLKEEEYQKEKQSAAAKARVLEEIKAEAYAKEKAMLEGKSKAQAESRAEDRRRLDAEKEQRELERKTSRISITATATQPDANGDFSISIQTAADTASLKIDGEEQGGKLDGSYLIRRVARVDSQNIYSITAKDVYGNTDTKTISVSWQVADSAPTIPKLNPTIMVVQKARGAVAIIVGIENYKRVAKADFANEDAKDFYTYANRALGIKPENIKLLVDDGAGDIEILSAFQNWLPLKVNKGKTDVYVFYSGHGFPSQDGKGLYFLPFNVDKQYLDRTSVKQRELIAALQTAQAKSVTLFIDACYSGQARNGETLVAGIKPIALKADEQAYPPDFTVITASAFDQLSSASADLKHGIFSFYLMKAMEGDADENKDGRITAGELQRYLSDKVGRQAMGMNRIQNTQLFGDADRVLVGR